MKKRIKVSFTQQSKMTVADTTVEYYDIDEQKFIKTEDVLLEAEQLQREAQKKASLITMQNL